MAVYPGDFNAVVAQTYSAEEQESIRDYIRDYGEQYDSLSDVLTDWRTDPFAPSPRAISAEYDD